MKTNFRRNGISLIEVIACMTILGIMMIPISSVMRASRQAVVSAENRSADVALRDGSRWVRRLIQDNTLLQTQPDVLVLQLTTGDYVKVYLSKDELVMNDGKEAVVLMSDVLDAQFGEIKQESAPGKVIGLEMAVTVLDTTTGAKKSLTSVVSIPTQF